MQLHLQIHKDLLASPKESLASERDVGRAGGAP